MNIFNGFCLFLNQGLAHTPGQHHQSPSERFSTALHKYIHLLLDKSPIKLMLNETILRTETRIKKYK